MARKTKKESPKERTKPPIDPQRQEDLQRLAELDSLLSLFWSSRSGSLFR